MGIKDREKELSNDLSTPEVFLCTEEEAGGVEGQKSKRPSSSSCSVTSVSSGELTGGSSSSDDMQSRRTPKRQRSRDSDYGEDRHEKTTVDKLLPMKGCSSMGGGGMIPPPNFEDIQDIIGSSGVWQLKVFLLAAFSGFCTALHNLVYGFIGAVPDHWCKLPEIENYSVDDLKKLLIPPGKDGGTDQCSSYAYEWNDTYVTVDNSTMVKCSAMDYDRSDGRTTVPMEWNLVCDDAPWASTIQIAYMTGILVGSPIIGAISDRYGRKVAMLIATVIFVITGPLIAFAPNFQVLIVLRFILALGTPGVYAVAYVLAIEVTSEKWRGSAGNYFNLPWALGYMTLPGIAYLVKDWKHLQILLSLPSLILLVTWNFLPESPRWLIRRGKLMEAERLLRKAAQVNRRERYIPPDFSQMIKRIYDTDKTQETKLAPKGRMRTAVMSYFSIVKSPKIRVRFLTLCVCWKIIGMTYYGLALNSSNLLTSRYVYTFIGGLLELPAYMIVPVLIGRYGRKRVFIVLVGTCGLALLTSLLFPSGSMEIIGLSYLGKFVIGAAYSLAYLYSSEMLPTIVRTYALGVCSMMARLGSTMAPLIVDVVGRDHHFYPSLIFGSLAMFIATLSLVLPETHGKPLPETIEDVEREDDTSDDDISVPCCRQA